MDITNFLKRSIEATAKAAPEARTFIAGTGHVRGIPLGNLVLEYVFASNVLLMERLVMLSGKPASCKSTLGFYLLKLAGMNGGGGQLVDTENKVSPTLLASILREYEPRVQVVTAPTLDKAQAAMTAAIQTYIKGDVQQDEPADPGIDDESIDFIKPKKKPVAPKKKVHVDNTWPFGIMMDSINPKTEATADKIAEEGSAGKSYADGANSNTTYLANMMGVMMGRNVFMVAVGHAKPGMPAPGSKPGMDTTTVPGGAAWMFHASYHFRLTGYAGKSSKAVNSKIVTIQNKKNSMGDENRKVKVAFYWCKSEEDATQQMSWFDWEQATVDLLTDKETMPVNKLSTIINVVKHDDGTVNCKELKLKDASPTEFAAALYASPEILTGVRKALGIHVYEELTQQ